MARVEIRLPSLLQPIAGGSRDVQVEASTVREAFDRLFAAHPALRVHLFDEDGAFRTHILCFHNDTLHRDTGDAPVAGGDRITILQAVSGG